MNDGAVSGLNPNDAGLTITTAVGNCIGSQFTTGARRVKVRSEIQAIAGIWNVRKDTELIKFWRLFLFVSLVFVVTTDLLFDDFHTDYQSWTSGSIRAVGG
jgi:hypothetical protein